MQTAIYAGLRNPGRDLSILNALGDKSVQELAADMRLAPSTIRAAAKRVSELQPHSIRLLGGGNDLFVGLVYAKCFRRAALGAYRHFCGTFRHLELTTWQVTDGEQSISITDLRDIDTGKASVNG